MILVQFFKKIEVQDILCCISKTYSIANHINVNFRVLIIWIWEESSDFSDIH